MVTGKNGKKLTRDEEIVRASKVKAAVIAFLDSHLEKHAFSTIVAGIGNVLEELNYSSVNLRSVLDTLAGHDQIQTERQEGKRQVSYFSRKLPKQEVIPKTRLPTAVKNVSKADLVIDIIKSTGQVRLSLNGLVIDVAGNDRVRLSLNNVKIDVGGTEK